MQNIQCNKSSFTAKQSKKETLEDCDTFLTNKKKYPPFEITQNIFLTMNSIVLV